MDFADEFGSRVQVVPCGQAWTATATDGPVSPLSWTSDLGYVAMDAFGFDWAACDGLNDAGLSAATWWLPETSLPKTPPARGEIPALDHNSVTVNTDACGSQVRGGSVSGLQLLFPGSESCSHPGDLRLARSVRGELPVRDALQV